MCMCECLWRSEINARHLSLLLSTLEPGAHPVPLTAWSASPQYPLIYLSAVWLKHGTWLLGVCWGSELRSSRLHGSHFTHWTVSLFHFFILLIIFKIRGEEGRERMLCLPSWILATLFYTPSPGFWGDWRTQRGLWMLCWLLTTSLPGLSSASCICTFSAIPGPHLSLSSSVECCDFLLAGKVACWYCFWSSARGEGVSGLCGFLCKSPLEALAVSESTSRVLTNHSCLHEGSLGRRGARERLDLKTGPDSVKSCVWGHWEGGRVHSDS